MKYRGFMSECVPDTDGDLLCCQESHEEAEVRAEGAEGDVPLLGHLRHREDHGSAAGELLVASI